MLEVAIIFIGFAFFISMFLNIKHVNNLVNGKLIYTLIIISFVSGSSILYFDIIMTKSEIARTTHQLANINYLATSLTPSKKVVEHSKITKPEKPPNKTNTHFTAESRGTTNSVQTMLHLNPGRTSTFNVPVGKAVNIHNVSCDVNLKYQSAHFQVKRGEGIILDTAEHKIEPLKLSIIETRPIDTDKPRGSPGQKISSDNRPINKPFTNNGLSGNQRSVLYGRPSCTAAISLI
ncbi:hypothetical protein KO525_09080 [Psychrosphaera sp. B3R10]|uniref:hypothetical protein n=1 Tax=unclassified Psychrosphaera TaxID=2641570 RepID=UPI001C0A61A3|nr:MULTISPECIES: hypothetical protein [unclassified Psychrosphaera]MBU2881461.1 hypothetical protein [Psychrosphaera sp. I2R16]MBU2989527.1 hypothetical protein [Psychrosphaera sp. B3R10]